MFERFNDAARRVVVLAQEEARLFMHDYIGVEHLLIALASDDGGVAGRVLNAHGATMKSTRALTGQLVGAGESPPPSHMPFTPRAKNCLELSLRHCVRLGGGNIGTEHLLLGLLDVGDSPATKVLEALGTTVDQIREGVIDAIGVGTVAEAVGQSGAVSAREEPEAQGVSPRMSERERQVLRLLAEGRSEAEIARALFISGNTVKNHLLNVLQKFQLDARLRERFTNEPAAPGPVCACGAQLSGSARYRILEVAQADGEGTAQVLFLFCSACGTTIDDVILPDT